MIIKTTGVKEILKRGYITNALTNENGEIYGLVNNHYINWELNSIEREHTFYWSEVYCEAGYCAQIIRKGIWLGENPSADLLDELHGQSKINLN